MKFFLALILFTSVAHAESNDLSWFSAPELTFENRPEQNKQGSTIQPSPVPDTSERQTPRPQRTVRSLERIDTKKASFLPPELKKCRNVFRATLNPSLEDAQIAGQAMGLSDKSIQNFKPDSFTLIFSTDPSCSQDNNHSPQLSSLLNELRQRALSPSLPGGQP